MGVSEGSESVRKMLEEIRAINFPNLMKILHAQEPQQILDNINTKRCHVNTL